MFVADLNVSIPEKGTITTTDANTFTYSDETEIITHRAKLITSNPRQPRIDIYCTDLRDAEDPSSSDLSGTFCGTIRMTPGPASQPEKVLLLFYGTEDRLLVSILATPSCSQFDMLVSTTENIGSQLHDFLDGSLALEPDSYLIESKGTRLVDSSGFTAKPSDGSNLFLFRQKRQRGAAIVSVTVDPTVRVIRFSLPLMLALVKHYQPSQPETLPAPQPVPEPANNDNKWYSEEIEAELRGRGFPVIILALYNTWVWCMWAFSTDEAWKISSSILNGCTLAAMAFTVFAPVYSAFFTKGKATRILFILINTSVAINWATMYFFFHEFAGFFASVAAAQSKDP